MYVQLRCMVTNSVQIPSWNFGQHNFHKKSTEGGDNVETAINLLQCCLSSLLRLGQHVSEHQNFCLGLTLLVRNVKESMR